MQPTEFPADRNNLEQFMQRPKPGFTIHESFATTKRTGRSAVWPAERQFQLGRVDHFIAAFFKRRIVVAMLAVVSGFGAFKAQAGTVLWTNAAGATAWYTTANWSPNTTSGAWLTSDVAQFANSGTATTAGINMGTASLSIGAVEVTSARTRALTIGNSSATAGTLTLNGATVNSVADVMVRNNCGSLLTLQNNETGSGKTMNIALGDATDNKIYIDSTGGITISSIISESATGRKLTKAGAGTGILTLSGVNTYTGKTTISGGQVNVNTDSSLGTAPSPSPVADQLTLNGGIMRATASLSMSANRGITLGASGGGLESAGITTILTLNNNITGTSGGNLTNRAGAVNLGGVNDFNGDFWITASSGNNVTMRFNSSTAGGNGTIFVNPIADSNITLRNSGVSSSTLANNITFNSGSLSTKFISLDSDSGSTFTLSGNFSGSAPVSVGRGDNNGVSGTAGGGTVVLTGDNSSYGGAVTVVAGTLRVNSPGSLAAGTAVGVSSGATLGGTGTINGTVTVNSGGTLAPGASIGTITFATSPTLSGSTSMEIDRAASPNADKLVLSSGTLTYGGTLTVANVGATLQRNDTFDLFDASAFGGSFTTTTLPSLPAGLTWQTSTLTTDGTIKVVCDGSLVGGADSFSTPTNTAVSVSSAKLLLNDTGTGLSVTAVQTTSDMGGTVSLSSGTVTYTPPSSTFGGSDTFTYTLTDANGCTAMATVTATVGSGTGLSPNVVYGPTIVGGNFVVRFAGHPGYEYTIEFSENTTGPWTKKSPNLTAPTTDTGLGIGVFEFSEPIGTSGYYRTVYPSY